MDRSTGVRAPEAYQPRLSRWGHVWRAVLVLALAAFAWVPNAGHQSGLERGLDLGLCAAAFGLMWLRRRYPVTIGVVTGLMTCLSASAGGPAALVLVSVATRRRWREIAVVAVAGFAGGEVFGLVQPASVEVSAWFFLTVNAVATAAMCGWGLYIGSRRELVWTLRQRVERAEAEQALRVGQARSTERARIAREMHDVLAHRISQIAMHAGALAFREDLSAAEMRTNAGVIQAKAHEALTDLRGVLGVLRDDQGELTDAPQPSYADLPDLVEEARSSGLSVVFDDRVADPAGLPVVVGRTVYRIVQEGITNAVKHAPGSRLRIELTGSPEAGVDVTLRNPLGFGVSHTPGAGLGLVGLSERAELRGGRLEHRREGDTFVLHGWIPWAA